MISPLSPDECAARLREVLSWSGPGPVIGAVSGSTVRLRKLIGYRNSFQTCLVGRLTEHDGGTLFHARTGMHPLVIVGMAVWFAGVGGFVVATAADVVAGNTKPAVIIFPLIMFTFGVCMVWTGRWLARDEQRFLTAFLAEAIDARVVEQA